LGIIDDEPLVENSADKQVLRLGWMNGATERIHGSGGSFKAGDETRICSTAPIQVEQTPL
jgi:hypothetical protein